MNKLSVIQKKIVDGTKISSLLSACRSKGQAIVFTNGCFDVLHRGHVEYLAGAASLGDVLVVGLNSDHSIRNIKGEGRPILDEQARAISLAAMQVIDYVVLFDEDTPYQLIQSVQPDVLVKGDDYSPKEIVGYDIVTGRGGEVKTVPFIAGYSTSAIIERIRSNK